MKSILYIFLLIAAIAQGQSQHPQIDVSQYMPLRKHHLDEQVKFIRDVSPKPSGGVRGFKAVKIKPGSNFDQLGLKVGDVVLSVDGFQTDNPAGAIKLGELNQTAEKIEVVVIDRQGKIMTLRYEKK